MKNLYAVLIALFITTITFAQVPEKMNYQAILRDSGDNLIANQAVGVQISVLKTTATGIAVYVETQTPMTNLNGLVTLEIGAGNAVSGDFKTINWGADSYFIKIETDPTGGTSYSITGTSQLLSVPYALHAKTSEVGDNLGNHTATQDVDLASKNVIGVNNITTGTIISTAISAVKTTTPTGDEGIIMGGGTSDYIISTQDGNGRVQHKWNASHGVDEKFIVGGEDAAFIDLNAFSTTDNDAWIEFKHADGATAVAGDPISWNTHLNISQAGKVGINEPTPDDMLHISSGGNGTRVRTENTSNGWSGIVAKNNLREVFIGVQGAFDATPGEFHIFDNTVGARRLVIDANGNVGIGRNNPSVKLDVNGSVNCTGGTCSSDKRWKKNIKILPNVLENIKQMRGVSYYWKTKAYSDQNFSKDKQIGVIAQEVEKIYPELVKTNEDGYKSMDYMSLTAVLLEGVKEQQNKIERLEESLNEVESLIKVMQSKIEILSSKK